MPGSSNPQTPEEIREAFAAEPGKGHLAEQALAELANARAYGTDTTAAEKRLAALGLGPAASAADRKAAAAQRRAALEELSSGPGRSGASPPVSYPENPSADADGQAEGSDPAEGQDADSDPASSGDGGGGAAASGGGDDSGGGDPASGGDDGAKSGDPTGGDPDAAAGGQGDDSGPGDGGAKARKTVTGGRKPGGPKATT